MEKREDATANKVSLEKREDATANKVSLEKREDATANKVSLEGRDLVRFMGLKWRFTYKVTTLSSDLVHLQKNAPVSEVRRNAGHGISDGQCRDRDTSVGHGTALCLTRTGNAAIGTLPWGMARPYA